MKFAFVAPSGSGKSTIIEQILHKFPQFVLSKSYTTRAKRNLHDNEYLFICEDQFLKLKEERFFLETEKIFSNWYGTPLLSNEDVIFNIDINGLYSLRKFFPIISIGIFVPRDEVEKRLYARSDTTDIEKRMKRYSFEISEVRKSDFIVMNDSLEDAIKIVSDIFIVLLHKQKILSFFNH